MHTPGGVNDVERPKPLLPTQPRKEFLGKPGLKRHRSKPMTAIQLQNPRDHELAQPAVGVVEKPGLLSRAAA